MCPSGTSCLSPAVNCKQMKARGWQSHGGPFSSRRARSGGWSPPGVGSRVPHVLSLMSPHPQVTMGIFMKLIEEINQVDNSCGRSTSCCLM